MDPLSPPNHKRVFSGPRLTAQEDFALSSRTRLLALAEFLCRFEDRKHFGDAGTFGVPRRWDQFSKEQKLERIVREPASWLVF